MYVNSIDNAKTEIIEELSRLVGRSDIRDVYSSEPLVFAAPDYPRKEIIVMGDYAIYNNDGVYSVVDIGSGDTILESTTLYESAYIVAYTLYSGLGVNRMVINQTISLTDTLEKLLSNIEVSRCNLAKYLQAGNFEKVEIEEDVLLETVTRANRFKNKILNIYKEIERNS